MRSLYPRAWLLVTLLILVAGGGLIRLSTVLEPPPQVRWEWRCTMPLLEASLVESQGYMAVKMSTDAGTNKRCFMIPLSTLIQ